MLRALDQPGVRGKCLEQARSIGLSRRRCSLRPAVPCTRRAKPMPPAPPAARPCLGFPARESGRRGCCPALGMPLALRRRREPGERQPQPRRGCAVSVLPLTRSRTRGGCSRFALGAEGTSSSHGAHSAAFYPPGRVRQGFLVPLAGGLWRSPLILPLLGVKKGLV